MRKRYLVKIKNSLHDVRDGEPICDCRHLLWCPDSLRLRDDPLGVSVTHLDTGADD